MLGRVLKAEYTFPAHCQLRCVLGGGSMRVAILAGPSSISAGPAAPVLCHRVLAWRVCTHPSLHGQCTQLCWMSMRGRCTQPLHMSPMLQAEQPLLVVWAPLLLCMLALPLCSEYMWQPANDRSFS